MKVWARVTSVQDVGDYLKVTVMTEYGQAPYWLQGKEITFPVAVHLGSTYHAARRVRVEVDPS